MPNLGGWEFVVLIGVLVLLFGSKRLPDMARSIGQSARVFKGEMKGLKGENPAADKAPAEKTAPAEKVADPASPTALPPATTSRGTPQQPTPAAQQGRNSAGQ